MVSLRHSFALLLPALSVPTASGYFSSWSNFFWTSKWNIQMKFNRKVGFMDRWLVMSPAARRWSHIINSELSDRKVPANTPPTMCGDFPSTIDDLYICASYLPMDGPGGVIGAAGATLARSDEGWLPYAGVILVDEEDVATLRREDTFYTHVLRDMGHVIGLSKTILMLSGVLVPSDSGSSCQYTGAHANAEWQDLSGCANQRAPIETSGGAADGQCNRWSEYCMQDELMTSSLEGARSPLSRMTIAALEDLGYNVNYEWADPFSTIDVNPDCVCYDSRFLAEETGDSNATQHRKLSQHGHSVASEWGKKYLNSMKSDVAPDDWVAHKNLVVLYEEDGQIYNVPVYA